MTLSDEIRHLMAAPCMNANDMHTLLGRDHDEIIQLARDLAECETGDERRALLRELNPAAFAHTRAEQSEVYDILLRGGHGEDAREIALEGYVAHGVIDGLLERMTKSRKTESDEWKAYSQVLLELISHHVEKERKRLYELLREQFSDDARDALGRRFAASKARLAMKAKTAACASD